MLTDETLVDRLRSLSRMDSQEAVRAELLTLRPEDLAEGFQRLNVQECLSLMQRMPSEQAAYVLVELPTELARQLLLELPDQILAHYLDILPMDDALELREELGEERFEALLEVIPREDALEIRRLLAYPEDTAGRLLTEAFVSVRPETTVAQLLEHLRQTPEDQYEMINDIYVLDAQRLLLGVFSLRRAIRAHPETTAGQLMRTEVISCRATDTAEDAARTMARYGLYALPVLDDSGRMVGILTGDDAQSILQEADTEDVLKLGAVSGDAEAYLSLSVWQLVWRRLPWLAFLFAAETMTGSVLRWYVGNPAHAPAGTRRLATIAQLSLFIPLLIGAGGNSGSQVTTTITRALALGEVKISDYLTVLRREFTVAVLVGLTLGLVGFLRAAYGWTSGWQISLIVGLALPAIVIWATAVGSVLPMGAKRLGIDPAVMSAPFIATFVDATGLVIYFEIAQRILGISLRGS